MRLPDTAHTSRPWRIHEIAPDFQLEDVWELPGRGRQGDFPRLVELIGSFDPSKSTSHAARALWSIRWKVGGVLGLDDPDDASSFAAATLRDRLPPDLRNRPPGPDFAALPFRSLYMNHEEFAAEVANETVHGVMHVGRVRDEIDGGYRAQMAVLVKPNGHLGNAYLAAIRPFRHLVIYPAVMRQGRELWERAARDVAAEDARSPREHTAGERRAAGVR